jgi:hypothetical protein
MYQGQCLCGAVQYELRGALGSIVLCHCSRCRRATGSAFAAAAPVNSEDFVVLAGEKGMREFMSSPGVSRFFCQSCGSPLFSRRADNPAVLRLRIGTIDAESLGSERTSAHLFVGSKAPWFEICDDLPQYAERP